MQFSSFTPGGPGSGFHDRGRHGNVGTGYDIDFPSVFKAKVLGTPTMTSFRGKHGPVVDKWRGNNTIASPIGNCCLSQLFSWYVCSTIVNPLIS